MSIKKGSKSKGVKWLGMKISKSKTQFLYMISIFGLLICFISIILTFFKIYEDIIEGMIYGKDILDVQYYLVSFMVIGVFMIFFMYNIIICRKGR